MEEKYYHVDIESGHRFEVTKEQHDSFQRLWEICKPRFENKLNTKLPGLLIFGTAGAESENANDFKELFLKRDEPI